MPLFRKKEKKYTKLPGTSRGLVRIHELFLTEEYLIAITQNLAEENYKRFYFKDIQAFISSQTNVWTINFIITVILTALIVLLPFIYDNYLLWLPLLPFTIVFGYLIYEKGTCKCWIQTSAQLEPLPSIKTIRDRDKVLSILKKKIQEVQGGPFDKETILKGSGGGGIFRPGQDLRGYGTTTSSGNIGAQSGNIGPQSGDAGLQPGNTAPQPKKENLERALKFHAPLFLILLLSGILTIIDVWVTSKAFEVISWILALAFWVVFILALVRQAGSGISKSLKGVTWASGAFWLTIFVVAFVVLMVLTIHKFPTLENPDELASFIRYLSTDYIFFKVLTFIEAAGHILLGAAGLLLVNTQEREDMQEFERTNDRRLSLEPALDEEQ